MALSGCASFSPPPISYDDPPEPAMLESEPPKPVQIVEVPKLLPLPGQLKPLPGPRAAPEPRDPRQRVDLANAAARVQPTRRGYLNAVQVYPSSGARQFMEHVAQTLLDHAENRSLAVFRDENHMILDSHVAWFW